MPGHPVDSSPMSLPSLQQKFREIHAAIEQLDRRIGREQPDKAPVHVSPFPPKWGVGVLWYDTESTAENP